MTVNMPQTTLPQQQQRRRRHGERPKEPLDWSDADAKTLDWGEDPQPQTDHQPESEN
jgi:hypothetical protein